MRSAPIWVASTTLSALACNSSLSVLDSSPLRGGLNGGHQIRSRVFQTKKMKTAINTTTISIQF
jgi:hypothetical protein